uniref:Uncharacterized protein n=1 Tax=Rhizophora mucronata TaxID=61149 RepID=A0A2P2NFZ9_RHIMU
MHRKKKNYSVLGLLIVNQLFNFCDLTRNQIKAANEGYEGLDGLFKKLPTFLVLRF